MKKMKAKLHVKRKGNKTKKASRRVRQASKGIPAREMHHDGLKLVATILRMEGGQSQGHHHYERATKQLRQPTMERTMFAGAERESSRERSVRRSGSTLIF